MTLRMTVALLGGFGALLLGTAGGLGDEPVSRSGIYPELAMFNDEGECGTGAVVPWADRLWVVTYAPHAPRGSSDKLYEITPDLRQLVRPESIGGTPANRMIHRESWQLFIGPYAISATGAVRVIPYATMFGRPTGNARHLVEPARKIYYASMEEALYEIDVRSLEVTELFRDEALPDGRKANLPGYHGKGLYTAQGRLVYANNGEHGAEARVNPQTPSGVLATWDGHADAFEIVRRNQFTEVTGPGGIEGNDRDTDPLWSLGWDHRSLILMLLDGGTWHTFRLPKGSHSYDGAHGWNTEWPRIREIGTGDTLLATMHGTFWAFPRTFSAADTAGIRPRSNYLKVIGDFCRWGDRVVCGCDDTARNEFLNTRTAKGRIAAPQSQSNLWFLAPDQLDHLGPVIGRGALWVREDVAAGTTTEPYLIAGYDRKGLHLAAAGAATITLEVDAHGTGDWRTARVIEHAGDGTRSTWIDLSDLEGVWLRLTPSADLAQATAALLFANDDPRGTASDPIFRGLATTADVAVSGGLVRARAGNTRTLAFAAEGPGGADLGCYELQADLTLASATDANLGGHTREHARIPEGVVEVDSASVVFTDDAGRRWRLPKGDATRDASGPLGAGRAAREVATERDLFQAHGTFYELPAENAGGFAKVRPVCSHPFRIHDFCSYRGLFVMTGVADDAPADNEHIVRAADGRAALWVGAIDDIWRMGKPRGSGGPWRDTFVAAGTPSDPYLMTAYDRKALTLASDRDTVVTAEVDVTGDGIWLAVRDFAITADTPLVHAFPEAFAAAWIRFRSDRDAILSAVLTYE
jgi:hypothetical protein